MRKRIPGQGSRGWMGVVFVAVVNLVVLRSSFLPLLPQAASWRLSSPPFLLALDGIDFAAAVVFAAVGFVTGGTREDVVEVDVDEVTAVSVKDYGRGRLGNVRRRRRDGFRLGSLAARIGFAKPGVGSIHSHDLVPERGPKIFFGAPSRTPSGHRPRPGADGDRVSGIVQLVRGERHDMDRVGSEDGVHRDRRDDSGRIPQDAAIDSDVGVIDGYEPDPFMARRRVREPPGCGDGCRTRWMPSPDSPRRWMPTRGWSSRTWPRRLRRRMSMPMQPLGIRPAVRTRGSVRGSRSSKGRDVLGGRPGFHRGCGIDRRICRGVRRGRRGWDGRRWRGACRCWDFRRGNGAALSAAGAGIVRRLAGEEMLGAIVPFSVGDITGFGPAGASAGDPAGEGRISMPSFLVPAKALSRAPGRRRIPLRRNGRRSLASQVR